MVHVIVGVANWWLYAQIVKYKHEEDWILVVCT